MRKSTSRIPDGTIEMSAKEIFDAVEGTSQLLEPLLNVDMSMILNANYQALEFMARPLLKADVALFKRFGKYDRKGVPVKAAHGDGFALKSPSAASQYHAEREKLLTSRHRVRVTPIKRSEFPREVDNKPVNIAGKTWKLLGPLLVD